MSWRATLEGVAYGLRDSLELLAEMPAVGRVSGGGARSDLWVRIVASVLGVAPTIICVLCPAGANCGAFKLSFRSARA